MLYKLASLLHSTNDKFDKKVKRHSPKMRNIRVTKGLMTDKIHMTREELTLLCPRLSWGKASLEESV